MKFHKDSAKGKVIKDKVMEIRAVADHLFYIVKYFLS